MGQEGVNNLLLELVGTGPCSERDLGRVAVQLLQEEGDTEAVHYVGTGMNQLDAQGLIGKTGGGHDRKVVLSHKGESVLESPHSSDNPQDPSGN